MLRRWIGAGLICAIVPLTWALSDWIVTGSPIFSLQYTTELATQLNPPQSLSELPAVPLRFLGELTKPPVFVAGVAGTLLARRLASWARASRTRR